MACIGSKPRTIIRRTGSIASQPVGKFLSLAFGLLLAVSTLPDPASGQVFQDDPDYIAGGFGYFDFIEQDEPSVEFRLEYRSDFALWFVKPWAGLLVNTDGGLWGGGGIHMDLHLADFVITPSFGVGGYSRGDSVDLGDVLEFRSQIELSYQFENRSRMTLYFSHLSNAGIGDRNPGTEMIGLYYMVPSDWLF